MKLIGEIIPDTSKKLCRVVRIMKEAFPINHPQSTTFCTNRMTERLQISCSVPTNFNQFSQNLLVSKAVAHSL